MTAFGAGLVDVTIKLGGLAPGKVANDFGTRRRFTERSRT